MYLSLYDAFDISFFHFWWGLDCLHPFLGFPSILTIKGMYLKNFFLSRGLNDLQQNFTCVMKKIKTCSKDNFKIKKYGFGIRKLILVFMGHWNIFKSHFFQLIFNVFKSVNTLLISKITKNNKNVIRIKNLIKLYSLKEVIYTFKKILSKPFYNFLKYSFLDSFI